MRSLPLAWVVSGVFALAGCAAERDSFEPIEPGSAARSAMNGGVRCSADEAGNLHVRAPANARVVEDRTTDDAAVEITSAPEDDPSSSGYPMPRPRRPRSRSLGFIGDAPLTQTPNHGDRYSYGTHDDLLPPHAHHTGFAPAYAPAYPTPYAPTYVSGWGYRGYGPGPGFR